MRTSGDFVTRWRRAARARAVVAAVAAVGEAILAAFWVMGLTLGSRVDGLSLDTAPMVVAAVSAGTGLVLVVAVAVANVAMLRWVRAGVADDPSLRRRTEVVATLAMVRVPVVVVVTPLLAHYGGLGGDALSWLTIAPGLGFILAIETGVALATRSAFRAMTPGAREPGAGARAPGARAPRST